VVGACVITSSSVGCNAPTQLSAREKETQAADPPAHTRVPTGAQATNAYFAIRVLNSKVCTVSPHLAPPPGVKKLAVELELTNRGDLEVPANPYYATLIDDKGVQFESTAIGCTPMLGGAPLLRGASTRGWVTFDVGESIVGQTITYEPALVGARSARAELELR
jgi:hypothetical protein